MGTAMQNGAEVERHTHTINQFELTSKLFLPVPTIKRLSLSAPSEATKIKRTPLCS